MSLLNDSTHHYSTSWQKSVKGVVKPVMLDFQKNFRLFPREICLISGAPRSGTSALIDWLGHQPGVSAFPESRILVSVHKFLEEANRFKNLESDSTRITSLARNLVYDYYSSSRILIGKTLLVDKEPLEPIAFPLKDYEKFILNVKKLLPDSRLILAIRDPLSTIWSMSRRVWGESLSNIRSQRFTLEEYTENWCSCADIVLQNCSDPKVYIVQFGRLIRDSANESKRIFNFLNIRKGILFRPQQTKEIGFTTEEREQILQQVQPRLDLLKSQGISNLS
jgi:hypothetical protein